MRMTLKEAREKRDLKQSEVAEFMGVSPSAVCQWEKGITELTTKKFYKLCRILRVEPEDIILP